MKIVNIENNKMYYVVYKKDLGFNYGYTEEKRDVFNGEKLNEMCGDYNIIILNFWEVGLADEDK